MGAYQPSSLIDFLAGREVEVEAIWGEPLRRARAIGIEMPRLESLYQRLLERCQRRA
jgi:2-dehydropantoate 2-reductase